MTAAARRLAAGAFLLALALPGWAQRVPQPAPSSDSNRAVDGFVGTLLVTPDPDWRQKWETPSSTAPDFNVVDTVKKGQRIFVLTFFSHARTGPDGEAHIDCDIDIVRPDRSHSTQQSNVACYRGTLRGGPDNIYLSSAVIGFLATSSDLSGLWTVNVSIRDAVGNIDVPLRTTFTLE